MGTVVVFPGLGVDYPYMVARFIARFPEAEGPLKNWRTMLNAPLGLEQPETERDRERLRQLEIHALNLLWWRQVRSEFKDAVFCGHSLGFYAALVACGALEEEASLHLVDRIFDLCWAFFAANNNPVIVLTARQAIDFAVLEHHEVEVLSVNCPRQVVTFAPAKRLEAACQALGEVLLKATPLASRLPFHSRAMTVVSWAIADRLAREDWKFCDPLRPVWSHIDAQPLSTRDEVMIQVIEQPHRRVRWQATVEALMRDGRRHFVEVGPNHVIGQILRWIDPGLNVEWVDCLRKQSAFGGYC